VAATSTAQARLATVDARFAGQKPQDIYLRVTGTHPLINDSLHQQEGSTWKEQHSTIGACTFAGGAHHVISGAKEQHCLSGSTNLSNFALQVRMTIVKGDLAGICFRADRSGTNYYDFVLNPPHDLYEFDAAKNRSYLLLADGNPPATKIALNQSYLVTVIAIGSHFYFYIDTHYIIDMVDTSNTLSSGQIGLTAGAARVLLTRRSSAMLRYGVSSGLPATPLLFLKQGDGESEAHDD
jgi:hypothetical protein